MRLNVHLLASAAGANDASVVRCLEQAEQCVLGPADAAKCAAAWPEMRLNRDGIQRERAARLRPSSEPESDGPVDKVVITILVVLLFIGYVTKTAFDAVTSMFKIGRAHV